MATAPRLIRMTGAEYLEIERHAEFKSEFFNGLMFPHESSPHSMAGTSYRHSRILSRLTRDIGGQLKGGPCEVIPSDLRVAISDDFYAYPDLVMICGEPQFVDNQFDTLTNPLAIIEILSPTTQAFDRNAKFAHYRQIPSLRHYILVEQETPAVEQYDRQADDSWPRTDIAWPDGILTLPELAVAVPLREIYLGIFPATPTA